MFKQDTLEILPSLGDRKSNIFKQSFKQSVIPLESIGGADIAEERPFGKLSRRERKKGSGMKKKLIVSISKSEKRTETETRDIFKMKVEIPNMRMILDLNKMEDHQKKRDSSSRPFLLVYRFCILHSCIRLRYRIIIIIEHKAVEVDRKIEKLW